MLRCDLSIVFWGVAAKAVRDLAAQGVEVAVEKGPVRLGGETGFLSREFIFMGPRGGLTHINARLDSVVDGTRNAADRTVEGIHKVLRALFPF